MAMINLIHSFDYIELFIENKQHKNTSFLIETVKHEENLVVMSRTRSFIYLDFSLFSPCTNDSVLFFVVIDWNWFMDIIANFLKRFLEVFFLFSAQSKEVFNTGLVFCFFQDQIFTKISLILLLSLTNLFLDHIQILLSILVIELSFYVEDKC